MWWNRLLLGTGPRPRSTMAVRRRSRARVGGFEQLERRTLLSAATPRILNGRVINTSSAGGGPDDPFPAVGIVGDRFGGFCTGTLISPQHVLTAAHCVEDVRPRAGRFTAAGSRIATSQIFVHPGYHPYRLGSDRANDIAIMELARPVTDVSPRPIYRGRPRVGQVLTLVGFGAGGSGRRGADRSFGTKRVGTTPIDGVTRTLIRWRFDNGTESNTGPGDSGGPAFIEAGGVLYVAGITSGGSRPDAAIGDRSFDTRVDAYQRWIDSILESSTMDVSPSQGSGGGAPQPAGDDYADWPGPQAAELALGAGGSGAVTGSLEIAGDRDVFSIQVDAATKAVIRLIGKSWALDPLLRLYDADGRLMAHNDDGAGRLNSRLVLHLDPGTYYVSAGAYQDQSAGDYRLYVRLVDDDYGDTFSTAAALTLDARGNGSAAGAVNHAGDRDRFKFVAPSSGIVTVRLTGQDGLDTVLAAYNGRGRLLRYNDDSGTSTDSMVRFRVRAGRAYYVEARGFRGSTGDYELSLRTRHGRRFRAGGLAALVSMLRGRRGELVVAAGSAGLRHVAVGPAAGLSRAALRLSVELAHRATARPADHNQARAVDKIVRTWPGPHRAVRSAHHIAARRLADHISDSSTSFSFRTSVSMSIDESGWSIN